jgi:hypothetical protein
MWSWRPSNLPSLRLHTVRPRIFIPTLSMDIDYIQCMVLRIDKPLTIMLNQ